MDDIKKYTEDSRKQLKVLSKRWDDLANEVPQKFMQLFKSGMKPKVERGNSGGRQLTVNLSFEMNTDAAKEYLEKAKDQIQDVMDAFKEAIEDINDKLIYYRDNNYDPKDQSALIKVFVAYYDYVSTAKIEISKNVISFNISDDTKDKIAAWKKYDQELSRIIEAKRLGVDLAVLDTHKKYLDAKRRMSTVKTSAAMASIAKVFLENKDYLDSATLYEEAMKLQKELKEKEEEAERQRLIEEERKRKEEEERKRIEEEKCKEGIYNACVASMSSAKTIEEYKSIIKQFKELKDYRDVNALVNECNAQIKEIQRLEEEARIKAEQERVQTLYEEALFAIEQDNKTSYQDAIVVLTEIKDYKDASTLIEKCNQRISEIEKLEEEARLIAEQEEKERKEKLEAEKQAKIKKKKNIMRLISIVSIVIILISIAVPYYKNTIVPKNKYNNALELIEEHKYDEAEAIFTELGSYSDSADMVTETRYLKANYLYETKEYEQAAQLFDDLGYYKESSSMYVQSLLDLAKEYYDAGKYQEAVDTLDPVEYSSGVKDTYKEYVYQLGIHQFASGLYHEGYATLNSLRSYKDAKEQAQELYYQQALTFYDNKEFDKSNEIFKKLGSYKDSKILIHEHKYTEVVISELTCEQNGEVERTCECGKVENVVTETPGHQYNEVSCTEASVCKVCGLQKEAALGHNFLNQVCERCGFINVEPMTFEGSFAEASEDVHTITVPKGTYKFTITTKLNNATSRWSIKVNGSEIYFGSSVTKKSGTFNQTKTITNENTETTITVKVNGSYTLVVEPVNK